MAAKKRKSLPAPEPIHDEIYEDFLVRYGYNTRAKMEKVHRAWLDYFHVEENSKNRDALRKRMEHLHPDKAACPPEKKAELAARRASRTEFYIADQDDDRIRDRERLEAVLEVAFNSVLNGKSERFTVRDVIDIIEQRRKLNDYEARLHGLFAKDTPDTATGHDIAGECADAAGLLGRVAAAANRSGSAAPDGSDSRSGSADKTGGESD